MSEAPSTQKYTPTWDCHVCRKGQGVCNGETMVVSTSCAREIFIRCAPIEPTGSPEEQAQKFYGCLPWLLEQSGAQMSNVVLERVFFRDAAADYDTFQKARVQAYGAAGVTGAELPAASYIVQPPCRPVQAFELQVYAIVPNSEDSVRVQSFPATKDNITTKLVEMNGFRHLYISNISGQGPDGKPLPTFRQQSDAMFERGLELLKQHGAPFKDVLRTWCYLDDIDRDYDEFNLSRNVFFEREGVKRMPASTGIRAGLYPPGTLCGYDLYCLLNPEGAEIEVMHTPTLNEAWDYGSSFSRGMRVGLPEKTVLYISGTASVDEQGDTVHIGDSAKQIERMLLNIQELLKPDGGTFANVTQVITYLKSANDYDLFRKIWDDWGLTGLPNTMVEAGVCRPNLLCEMEMIAIVPR